MTREGDLDVVTGAFSFTGRYIAEELIRRGRRVRTLTRKPCPSHPLASAVESAALRFESTLVESLRGADTLYNTYWVRFERGRATFASAVANTRALLEAAAAARVRRVVHLSVAGAAAGSPFPYFRGKAETDAAVRACGLSYAIVRPTLVFGPQDILFNNIAWILRRVPVFPVPGDGRYEVQPVSVTDTARIACDAGGVTRDLEIAAAGPDRLSFTSLVRLVAAAVGSRSLVTPSPARLALLGTSVLGVILRDVVLTRDELGALAAGLLVTRGEPTGGERLAPWLREHGHTLGRAYASELGRNFR